MIVEKTKLDGCLIFKPKIFKDKRGYFIESFNNKVFNSLTGMDVRFVQDNESESSKGVLRGLHYQAGEHAQAKLVRVIKGQILDVVVDLRSESTTFRKHFTIELSEENKTQIFVPKGFAHGFVTLSETAIVSYKCDNYYNKESEAGIIYNDPELKIDWQLPEEQFIISPKDLILPQLQHTKLC